ncbi:hypothetical protein NO995_00980 [Aestuariibaculum sp. M13]|uniref:hypothetical protein n=1 Tax=Aestuariibaculum sp. M13 TaxID=2967132 RepID=UPI002159D1DB|nr:hypothetical protein [Aestuariibaculum sp. M13]MCR8666244.1 hypothetical protein [Aestuariibaculum sp. M13]
MNLKYYIVFTLSTTLLIGYSKSNKKKKDTLEIIKTEHLKTEDSLLLDDAKGENSIKTIVNTDSIQLTTLIRKAYEWHMDKYLPDFPYLDDTETDTIFTGIDWEVYNKNIELLKSTNYFTNEFLSHHKSIATTIDRSIKTASIEWRHKFDISIWDSEADDWCYCQDHPDNYWETLIIDQLNIENNFASFNLNWKMFDDYSSMEYKVTARKVDGLWKINSLEGYKAYKTFEDYEKIMND